MRRRRGFLLTAALALGAVTITACSSGGTATEKATATGLSAQTQAAVEAAYHGSFGAPPTTSPKPQPGKDIWLVTLSATYGAPGEMVAAAKLIGWHLTVFDGKFSPDIVIDGLRQAIADHADGVIVAYADCATIKAGLQDVTKAGIPVVNIESSDCNQQIGTDGVLRKSGQPALFDSGVGYNNPANPNHPLTFAEFYQTFATYQALGVIDGMKGRAKIIALSETDLRLNFVALRSFKATLKARCPACQIVDTVEFVGTDFGTGLQQKIAQALVQHPEANAIYGGYDTPSLDAAAAVQQSGRKNDIFVMGGQGTAPIVDLIRQDRGVNAGAGFSTVWEYYAALDAINRLLHGQRPSAGGGFPSGIGVQLFTKSRNLPPPGQRFAGPIDFEAAYRKAWGVSA